MLKNARLYNQTGNHHHHGNCITKKTDDNEVELMQSKDYSKDTFGLDYPLLVPADGDVDSVRYYASPLTIKGELYRLCSQWFEVSSNNDRPQLLALLNEKAGTI